MRMMLGAALARGVACALLVAGPAAAQTHPMGGRLSAGLEGMRVDVSISSTPVPGGHELVVTNEGDDAHIALGCYCHRGVLLSEIAPLPEPDWPDDRIVMVFTLKRGETSRVMLAVAGKLHVYMVPLVVLSMDRTIVTRSETSVYDGAPQ